MSPQIALAPLVSFDGVPLAATWRAALVELRVEHRYQVPSRCTLRFSDPGYALAAASRVQLGVLVHVGAPPDGENALIDAEVTDIALEQRVGDHPELVVTAYDKSHRLGRATDVKSYREMTFTDVVSELAGRAGLVPRTDATTLVVSDLLQVDSALGLLSECARRAGYDWWVEGQELNFKKPAAGRSVSLGLGTDLLSFSARASGHFPSAVTVGGWDRTEQQSVTATATGASDGVVATSSFAALRERAPAAFGEAKLTTGALGAHSNAEATQLAQALYDTAAAASVHAEGVALGDGRLRLGASAEVKNAGPLSGTYPLTRVEHVFRPASGFVTRFSAGDRRPATLADTLRLGPSLNGPATGHVGLVVGKVTSLKDPDHLGRIRLQYPGLSAEQESGWARVAVPGGGDKRGVLFLPEVNDEVLVAFEGGDFRQPVVVGGLYGRRSALPNADATLVDEGTGTLVRRGLYSRLDNALEVLDGDAPDKQAIELRLGGGEHKVHLGKDKLAVSVPGGYPVEVSAGGTSIKIGNDGAVTISAPQVSITAEEKFSVSAPKISLAADAQLSLQSEGTVSLQGADVSVSAEGPLSASGQPVMIN